MLLLIRFPVTDKPTRRADWPGSKSCGRRPHPTPPTGGSLESARKRRKSRVIGVRAEARTLTESAMPTRHPMDPGGMPSVPSSKLGKRTPYAAPREAARCRHVSHAARIATPFGCCKPAVLPAVSACRRIDPPWVFGPPRRGADPLLWLRRAARARGSACQRRQGRSPLTPLSARAIFSRRIPAADASFGLPPLVTAPTVFAQHHRSGQRPSRSDPDKPSSRRPLRGQRDCPACPPLPMLGNHAAHGFQSLADSGGRLPNLGRSWTRTAQASGRRRCSDH